MCLIARHWNVEFDCCNVFKTCLMCLTLPYLDSVQNKLRGGDRGWYQVLRLDWYNQIRSSCAKKSTRQTKAKSMGWITGSCVVYVFYCRLWLDDCFACQQQKTSRTIATDAPPLILAVDATFVSWHLHRAPARGYHTLNKFYYCMYIFCKIQYKKRNTLVCCFVRTNRWYLIFNGSGPTVCSAWNPAFLEICYVHYDSVWIWLVCDACSHCNRKLWMIISASHWNCFLKSMQTWLGLCRLMKFWAWLLA